MIGMDPDLTVEEVERLLALEEEHRAVTAYLESSTPTETETLWSLIEIHDVVDELR